MKYDYTLIHSSRKTFSLQIKNGQITLRAPNYATRAQADAFLRQHERWIETHLAQQERVEPEEKLTREELQRLAEEAAKVIPERVRHYAERVGVDYGRITIRCQRTRWGSCSSAGNLNFNCLLMLMPPQALDAVVVHELCHRKEMNHSPRFYEEVRRVYPEYDRWNRWLKENGNRYLQKIPD